MQRSMRSWKVLTAMHGAPCGPSSKKMCNWSSSFEICMQHQSMASAQTRNPCISSGISPASAKHFANLSFVSCASGRLPTTSKFYVGGWRANAAEISRRGRTFVPARHGPKVNIGTPSRPGRSGACIHVARSAYLMLLITSRAFASIAQQVFDGPPS